MKRALLVITLGLLAAATMSRALAVAEPPSGAAVVADPPQAAAARSTFGYVDLFVDAGDAPLAAYQIDFHSTTGGLRIVGVEGGEHALYRDAPYYDPRAMQGDRVIIAAYAAGPREALPVGPVRVARVHVMYSSDADATLHATLDAAANFEGDAIDATIAWRKGQAQ